MNKLQFTRLHIEIQCERNDTVTQGLVKNFYPVTSNRIGTSFKVSTRQAPEVLKVFRDIDETNINTAPAKIQEYWYAEIMRRNKTAELLRDGPTVEQRVNDHLVLKKHQALGRELARYHDRFAFYYDTRTGKTPLSLTIIYDDLKAFRNHRWLVVCPLILIEQAWLPDSAKFFPEIPVVNCWASTKTKRLIAMQQPGNIYITNTESFITYREYFNAMKFDGCILDESSSMKSNSSKFSKEMVDYAQYMDRFYLLSGTPAPNGEHEYYMQMRAVDYYAWQQSYSQFKLYYFVNLSFDPMFEKLAIRPDRKEELMAAVKNVALFMDKEDVLDTPGRTFHECLYDLPDALKKHYTKMKNELATEIQPVDTIEGREIVAASAAAKLNKLNQITSGFVLDTQAVKENKFYGSELAEWHLLDDWRFRALEELLNSKNLCGEQVLIWANYRREFELIQSLLGERCRCIHGGTSINEKNANLNYFKSGRLQYLAANPASADKGLTLTNCHICVYFSLNWSFELFKQSYDRIYGDRSIQPKHCDYYIMMANGTIDVILYRDVLQGKSKTSYEVLNHLKAEVFSSD